MRDLSSLKICFLAGTLEHGGSERQLFYMLEALRQQGAAPRLLCLDRGEYWEGAIRSLGVPITWVGQRQSRLARLVRVLKELREDPPDLFQSQHFFANAYVALTARVLGVGSIGAMRNEETAERRGNGRLGGWVNLHLPRVIAANTRVAIRQAVTRGLSPSRLHFLPNVVDTQRFKPGSGSGERPLTLLAIGRVTKQKRFDRFISAVARLRTQVDLKVRAWIAGPAQDEGLRTQLEAQATELGLLPGCLEFLGGVSDMISLYLQADACVLTSDFEGTPNVLLEAMASGLPVVATSVGGVPEIVRHGETGFLARPDDMAGLVAALVRLVKDAPLRAAMGRRARAYIEQNHSLTRLPRYLYELYDRALPSRCPWKLGVVEGTSA